MKQNRFALGRAIGCDLRCAGITCLLWCVPALLAVPAAKSAAQLAQVYHQAMGIDQALSFPALLLALYAGPAPYSPSPQSDPFRLPMTWAVQQLWTLFMVYLYPALCLRRGGGPLVVEMKRRHRWWFSKCGFVVLGIAAGYLLQHLVLLWAANGSVQNPLQANELLDEAFSVSVLPQAAGEWVWYLIVMPFLASVTGALLQITCMLWAGPAAGFLSVVIYWCLSAFFFQPLLLFNFGIPRRSALCMPGGLRWQTGAAVLVAVCAVCVAMGAARFQRMDLLGPEKE